jgi:hypothetical protein
MPESRTVLPAAPKLLNLTRVRATENAITLFARTSSRVALFVRCAGGDPPGSILVRRGCWLTCYPGRESPLYCSPAHVRRFFCDEEACNRTIFAETIARCRRALRSHNRAARWLVHERLLRSRRGSGLSPSERSWCPRLWRYPAQPHTFVTASGPPNAQSIERGGLRLSSWDSLWDGTTSGFRTSRAS